MSKVSFAVKGEARELELDTWSTLLDALRERLHLTGARPLGQLRGWSSWHTI